MITGSNSLDLLHKLSELIELNKDMLKELKKMTKDKKKKDK